MQLQNVRTVEVHQDLSLLHGAFNQVAGDQLVLFVNLHGVVLGNFLTTAVGGSVLHQVHLGEGTLTDQLHYTPVAKVDLSSLFLGHLIAIIEAIFLEEEIGQWHTVFKLESWHLTFVSALGLSLRNLKVALLCAIGAIKRGPRIDRFVKTYDA